MKSTLAPAVMDCPIEQRCTVTLNLLRVGSYFFFDITAISCYFEDQSETKKDMTIFGTIKLVCWTILIPRHIYRGQPTPVIHRAMQPTTVEWAAV